MSHEFDELKDCPFCGNKSGRNQVETIRWTNTAATLHRNKSQVICRNCNATAGAHLNSGDAVRAWNQRSYDYDMPAIVKKVQQLEKENEQLKKMLALGVNYERANG